MLKEACKRKNKVIYVPRTYFKMCLKLRIFKAKLGTRAWEREESCDVIGCVKEAAPRKPLVTLWGVSCIPFL